MQRSFLCRRAMFAAAVSLFSISMVRGAVLLNDSWADGDRTNTNLPTDSHVYVGIASGGAVNTTVGQLAQVQGASSSKLFTYFTSDNSVPDANQPHNSVTTMSVGDKLTASLTFSLPAAPPASTGPGKDFRFGLFFAPDQARLLADSNSDTGGGSFSNETGYAAFMGLSSGETANHFQMGKRTVTGNLISSGSQYTQAATGGTAASVAAATSYTAQLMLNEISATQMDVTASLLQGTTVLSSQTVSDTGTAFGTTAVGAGLSGNTSIYTKFDQMFFRMSGNTEASEIDFTNFKIELVSIPEPGSMMLLCAGALFAMRGRRTGRLNRAK